MSLGLSICEILGTGLTINKKVSHILNLPIEGMVVEDEECPVRGKCHKLGADEDINPEWGIDNPEKYNEDWCLKYNEDCKKSRPATIRDLAERPDKVRYVGKEKG